MMRAHAYGKTFGGNVYPKTNPERFGDDGKFAAGVSSIRSVVEPVPNILDFEPNTRTRRGGVRFRFFGRTNVHEEICSRTENVVGTLEHNTQYKS